MGTIFVWVSNQQISQIIRTSAGLLLAIRYLHFLAIMFVVVSISKVDLRLMGMADRKMPVTELLAEILPWTWWSFGVAAVTGMLLFISRAPSFYGNDAFRLKILFIGLAGITMAVFHAFTYRNVASWNDGAATPFAAKLAGAFSLTFWIAAAVFGLRVAYTVGR